MSILKDIFGFEPPKWLSNLIEDLLGKNFSEGQFWDYEDLEFENEILKKGSNIEYGLFIASDSEGMLLFIERVLPDVYNLVRMRNGDQGHRQYYEFVIKINNKITTEYLIKKLSSFYENNFKVLDTAPERLVDGGQSVLTFLKDLPGGFKDILKIKRVFAISNSILELKVCYNQKSSIILDVPIDKINSLSRKLDTEILKCIHLEEYSSAKSNN